MGKNRIMRNSKKRLDFNSYPECHWFESDRRYHKKVPNLGTFSFISILLCFHKSCRMAQIWHICLKKHHFAGSNTLLSSSAPASFFAFSMMCAY